MRIVILIIGIVTAVYFLLLHQIFRVTFSTKKKREYAPTSFPKGEQYQAIRPRMEELVQNALQVPFEEVHIQSFDGLNLYGRVYRGDPGRPVDILFHGWRSNAVRDFAGGAALAREAHDTVILVDERGINGSEGEMLTFGILERKDVLSWTYYADRRWNYPKIMLYGVSMGAATVLMSLDQKLPPNVCGVIADSPYTSPKAIICKVAADMHLPVRLTWALIWQAAHLFGHFDPEESDAVKAVSQATVPVLLIHGDDDRFVPYQMSKEIAEANAEHVSLELFQGAAHGVSFIADEERYRKAVAVFCKRCLHG